MAPTQVGRRTRGRPGRTKIKKSSAVHSELSPYFYYALLLMVLIFFALLRFRLRDMPLERDEGEYAYGGQLLLHGISLYRLVYTVKLPGTHAAYAAILAIFGQTQAGIHIGLLLVNAATTLLIFILGARLFGRLAGFVAGASYALLSTSPSVMGFEGHATHFVVLFAISGTLLLLQALNSGKNWLILCAGLLFGMAFLMKQPGIFFVLWAIIYFLWRKLSPPVNWKNLAVHLTLLSLGSLIPFVLTCLLMWRAGIFQKFWFWTFLYARQYGAAAPLADGFMLFRTMGASVVLPVVAVWLIAAVGLTAFLWSARARSNKLLVLSFFLFSFLAVCPGLYFRPHYFILLLPAISILTGMAVGCGTDRLLEWKGSRSMAAIPVLVFLIAFIFSIYQQREFLFQMDPLEACEALYGRNPFPEALQIANYIRGHSPDNATIAVLGSEPEIYFYSKRRSATGYIYMYPLLENQKYALEMQKEMEREIENARPDMLVLVNVPKSWVAFASLASTEQIMNWSNAYIREHYDADGVAEMGNVTSYRWGSEANGYQAKGPLNLYLLKRKAP